MQQVNMSDLLLSLMIEDESSSGVQQSMTCDHNTSTCILSSAMLSPDHTQYSAWFKLLTFQMVSVNPHTRICCNKGAIIFYRDGGCLFNHFAAELSSVKVNDSSLSIIYCPSPFYLCSSLPVTGASSESIQTD